MLRTNEEILSLLTAKQYLSAVIRGHMLVYVATRPYENILKDVKGNKLMHHWIAKMLITIEIGNVH